MAAYENVSRYNFRPHNRESEIDIRLTRLPSSLSQTEEFDPREHREPQNPIQVWMAYFNLVRIGLGAGVLGVPLAISQAGIILGPMIAMFTCILVIHTHLILLKCLNEISRHLKIPYISYRYGFRIALLHGPSCFQGIGNKGPTIIATFMLLSQLGMCTVFVTFTSDSLRDIMDWQDSKPALFSLLIPYLLLEFFMKNLKIVSYVAVFGSLLNTIGLILVFYHIFKDPHGDMITIATEGLPVLFAFGTFLFNLSAVGVILSLDKSLVKPIVMIERFGVINVGIMVPTIISTIFGILGYWSFGTMEENVLRSLPFDDLFSTFTSAMAAIGLYIIAIGFAYPLQCYPAIQIILEVIKYHDIDYEPSQETLRTIEIIARPLFVLLSFTICYFVPFQGVFITFGGNVCATMLALVFPAMMEISMLYPSQYGKYNVYFIKNVLIIILGCLTFVLGSLMCCYLIYVRLMSAYSPNDTDYFR